MEAIRVKKLREGALLPTYGTAQAAGADLYAGLALEVPEGCAGLVYARSGLATKRGLAPANKVGVIDSDYRGEITVVLYNHGPEPQTIASGERIAQLIITPVLTPAYMETDRLTETLRGTGGFGSTGK